MKTRTLTLIAATFAFAGALPLTASAMPHNPAYDLNGDGQIAPEEVQQARAEEFPKIDTDGNGYLSFAELQAWADAQKTARFTALDTDGNGALSEAEFLAGKPKNAPDGAGSRIFKLLDADGNGALSLAEFKTMGGLDRLILNFARMDTDNDGQISQTEYLTPPPKGSAPADNPPPPPANNNTSNRTGKR